MFRKISRALRERHRGHGPLLQMIGPAGAAHGRELAGRSMAGVLVLLLTGCNLAPTHERPALPTSASYPELAASETAPGVRAGELRWRDFFADPRLEALVAAALERNRDLVIATARVEEARGLYRIQRADRLPTVGISGSGSRNRVTSGSAETAVPGAGSAVVERYSIGVGISSFELDFWGRVRNLAEAARSQYLSTVQARRAFELSLIRDVASAYLGSLEATERTTLAEATLQSRKEGLRIADVRLKAGITSALDFRQAETLLTQAETEIAGLRLTQAQSDNFLAVLVGGPVSEALPAALPLVDQRNGHALAAGLPSDLLVTRPDILAAEENLRAARANIGAARAAFFPNITLTGSLGYASSELEDLVGSDQRTWSFGPSINLPIFDFGRNRGNLSVADARENIAVAEYERAIQIAFQDVADALAGRRFLAEQVASQERGTLAQRRIADLARKRYNEGVVSYIEVLDAERNLFAAEQALLQFRRAEADNLVALYIALGGGPIQTGEAAATPAR
ncbi:MAG: efflux transporter outer membrane subunit [Panacagrimonas sp.]